MADIEDNGKEHKITAEMVSGLSHMTNDFIYDVDKKLPQIKE